MFNIEEINNSIRNSVLQKFSEGQKEIEDVLSSGYEGIIKSFEVGSLLQDIVIVLEDDIISENQNVIGVLVNGGTLLRRKDDGTTEDIGIKPSATMKKYLDPK